MRVSELVGKRFAAPGEQERVGGSRERGVETDRTRVEAKVTRMAAVYLADAQSLANSTGRPIQVWRSGLDPTSAGFRIRVGGTYSLVARLVENRWEVTTHTRRGTCTPSFSYPTDQAFENAREELLEPIVGDALNALLRRNAALQPAPGSLDPEVTAPLGPPFWQKILEIEIQVSARLLRSLVKVIAALRTGFDRSKLATAGATPVLTARGGTTPDPDETVRQNDPSPAPTVNEAIISERLRYIRELSQSAGEAGKSAGFWSSRRGRSTVVKLKPRGASTPWRRP